MAALSSGEEERHCLLHVEKGEIEDETGKASWLQGSLCDAGVGSCLFALKRRTARILLRVQFLADTWVYPEDVLFFLLCLAAFCYYVDVILDIKAAMIFWQHDEMS